MEYPVLLLCLFLVWGKWFYVGLFVLLIILIPFARVYDEKVLEEDYARLHAYMKSISKGS